MRNTYMKRLNWFLLATMLLIIPVMQSCDDGEGYSLGQFGESWATVRALGGNAYYLESDSYGTLWPAASRVYGYRPVSGERVLVLFNPLYDDFDGYDLAVKIDNIIPVLTKQVEDLTEENESEIGNDPIHVQKKNIWIANGYMNVIFMQNTPLYKPHLLNLVNNLLVNAEDDGYVHLEFRYNTYDDLSGWGAKGCASFNLRSIDFTGKKGLKLKYNSAISGETEEVTFDIKEKMSLPEEALNLDYSELEVDKVK